MNSEPSITDPNLLSEGQEIVSITLSTEVIRALEALHDPGGCSAFIERAIRRELRCAPLKDPESVENDQPAGNLGTSGNAARPTGRPRKHTVEDLVGCLGLRTMTTSEFFKRANETLDCSRATFYRLLEKGRKQWRFRQNAMDQRWRLIS